MSHYRIKLRKRPIQVLDPTPVAHQHAALDEWWFKILPELCRAKLLAVREEMLRERGLPSAADLDAVAEEERIREATE